MKDKLSASFWKKSLGAAALAACGYAGVAFLNNDDILPVPVDYTHKVQNTPLTIEQFKAHVDEYSRNNMMVVVLRRNSCDICPGVGMALAEARYYLQSKIQRGFAVYELNAEQNPEVAALLRQRDPQAPARLHVFYNGEKIYESVGITDNPRHLMETLEMVQALADGEVSAYDKYQPAQIFPVPNHP